MDTYVIKERGGIWAGCLMGIVTFVAALLLHTAGYGAIVFVSACGIMVTLIVLHEGIQTKVFSSEGICVKKLFNATTVHWNQVDRLGVVWMRLGNASPRWYISVTWQPQTNRKTWVQYWFWWMKLDNKSGFLFPYTDELYDTIVKYYGPLDYDGRRESHTAVD